MNMLTECTCVYCTRARTAHDCAPKAREYVAVSMLLVGLVIVGAAIGYNAGARKSANAARACCDTAFALEAERVRK